jgi:two-component system response regulator GlrR
VWISGEDGVDKELVARLIHDASEWTNGEFFALDAAVVPRALLARELFGAEAGAIPGLPAASEGAFGRAAGGTVLLENIEDVPKDLQQMLATALERGRYRRVGGDEVCPLVARLIAASRYGLEQVTAEGRLAPELSEQLRLLEITLPPLAERREDVVPIAADTLSIARRELEAEMQGAAPARRFSAAALERLVAHPWPGNERELREQVSVAVRMASGDEIEPGDLALGWDTVEGVPAFRDAKRAFEREYVTRVLRLCKGNISKAARVARKDRKDFYDVMRRNSIDPSEFRS